MRTHAAVLTPRPADPALCALQAALRARCLGLALDASDLPSLPGRSRTQSRARCRRTPARTTARTTGRWRPHMGCGRVLSGCPTLHIDRDPRLPRRVDCHVHSTRRCDHRTHAGVDPDLILVPAVHNTKDDDGARPTRYYAYSSSCHLTNSTRSAALTAVAAIPDAPVAYHRRVRIATDRFPATPGIATAAPRLAICVPFCASAPPRSLTIRRRRSCSILLYSYVL
jgi:hypothetical protein